MLRIRINCGLAIVEKKIMRATSLLKQKGHVIITGRNKSERKGSLDCSGIIPFKPVPFPPSCTSTRNLQK